MPRVYIDTNVVKFSATQLPRLYPRATTINWGGRTHDVTVHDLVIVNPNQSITNPDLKREADLLTSLADLGKSGVIEFLANIETLLESWGLPNMDSGTGLFYGAPVGEADAPIQYSRIMFGAFRDPGDDQFRFLSSLNHKRFLEWQRAAGAYQGQLGPNQKQLLDAFHLWCAEHNRCEFFLTLDFKLIRVLRSGRHKSSVQAVKPSELLQRLPLKSEI